MAAFVFVVALVLLTTAICAVALAGPWRMRLGFLLATDATDPVGSVTCWSGITMRAVTLVDVRPAGGSIQLSVADGGSRERLRRWTFSCATPATGVLARLEGWAAVATPLLLTVHANGIVQLAGPDCQVLGLEQPPRRERQEVTLAP